MDRDVKIVVVIGAVALALALALPLVAYSMYGGLGLTASPEAYGVEENATVTGTVKEAYHMMLELETPEGEEVEVMVPGVWQVSLPDGSEARITGWELVEEHLEEGWNITVTGYLYEGPTCMGVDEAHIFATGIEVPGQGLRASLLAQQ